MGNAQYTTLESRGFVQLATSTTAIAITGWVANSASGRQGDPNFAYICVDGASARWRDDGTAPTATSGGMPLAINTILPYDGELRKFQICTVAGTGSVNITYYNAY